MKKSTHGSALSSISKGCRSIATLVILMLATLQAYSQVDCDVTMACNDTIQVSLDGNCSAFIAADMMLEDPAYDNSEYTVMVMMPNGNIVPGNTVNANHIGMTLEVNVVLTDCGNSCWGNIVVEDKLPPTLSNCGDFVIECADNPEPGFGPIPLPTVNEACGFVASLTFVDQVTDLPCSSGFVQNIVRVYTVTDNSGNTGTCTQNININRANINTVVFPPNYDDLELPAFECQNLPGNLLPNGAPSPDVTGRPVGVACPNIQVYYEDIIFDVCGASKKILRSWLVLDWCTGLERTENQIIKIKDELAPICTTPPDFLDAIPTDPGECTATYNVPPPIVILECSDYNYTVSYKLRDENGNPFLNPINDNVFPNGDGTFRITDLPQDTTWIIYTLVDVCGNESQCFTEVFVEDVEAPTPVCEGFTVVSLEDAGWADLFATSIDDNSFDNCGVERFEVKRFDTPCGFSEDLVFGEKINFCCEDVTDGPIMVTMRAYDEAGNFNDCVVNVTVQDKKDPTIVCPPNLTLDCDDDFTNMSLTGTATAFDNCSAVITSADNVNLNDCGFGTVRRTFTATDAQGRKASCVQIITIGDSDPLTLSDIQFPADVTVNGCDASSVTPEALNSFPIINGNTCTRTAVSANDQIFYNVPDLCIKILRTWTVADECNFDPQNPGLFTYVQKINVANSEAPVITSDCSNLELPSVNGSCEADYDQTITATDDCTPGALLRYSYTIDLENNGSIDVSQSGKNISRTLPAGTHRITIRVEDSCDNPTECSYFVTVRDNKPPTPICLGEVIWVIDEDGRAEIWANDFNLKSEDTCTPEDELRFSFNEAGNQTSLEFTCADIPNGVAETIELRMYVIDTDGNSEYCDVKLLLQDSELTNACNDVAGIGGRIAGTITTKDLQGIDDIEVKLVDMEEQVAENDMTYTGQYDFEDIAYYTEYMIAPSKNDDLKNGVNTLDLVKIQRHILGLEPLSDAYTMIAADINNDERVTAADLLSLRKVILGVSDAFPNNESWRFIPAHHEFASEEDPFGFPEEIMLDEFYNNVESADFTAVKVGDIDGTVTVNVEGLKSNNLSTSIAAVAPAFEEGEIFTVDFRASELRELVGMQMTIDFDSEALTYSAAKSGILAISDQNIGLAQSDNGQVAISWNDVNPLTLNDDDILFTLTFKANVAGELSEYISLNSDIAAAQSYDSELNTSELTLTIASDASEVVSQSASENKLYQNVPNPFAGSTSVRFDLARAGTATLTVYDISGKILDMQRGEYDAGRNEMTVNVDGQSTTSGVLYYTLETADYQATRKMVVIK